MEDEDDDFGDFFDGAEAASPAPPPAPLAGTSLVDQCQLLCNEAFAPEIAPQDNPVAPPAAQLLDEDAQRKAMQLASSAHFFRPTWRHCFEIRERFVASLGLREPLPHIRTPQHARPIQFDVQLAGAAMRSMPVRELQATIAQLQMRIQELSAELVLCLDEKDELQHEQDVRNHLVELLLRVVQKFNNGQAELPPPPTAAAAARTQARPSAHAYALPPSPQRPPKGGCFAAVPSGRGGAAAGGGGGAGGSGGGSMGGGAAHSLRMSRNVVVIPYASQPLGPDLRTCNHLIRVLGALEAGRPELHSLLADYIDVCLCSA
eukprot:m.26651 g.26651  ORF g.26651 m.26651 type:complete len:318 (+) comp4630_c0_seq1:123-1076(+)